MNSSETGECTVQPMGMQPYWKALLIILYGSVGVASLVGNLCVVLVVLLRKEMQTVTNIFISSVSIADLVITGVSLWATPMSKYLRVWVLGPSMCYTVSSIQGASLIWVPFTLAVIAVDRYLMVASPFRAQMSIRTCFFIIIGIWITAFAVLTPSIINLQYLEFDCHKFCFENWYPNNTHRLLYGIAVLVIRSGIPLVVIAWCNWRIAAILRRQGNKFHKSTMRYLFWTIFFYFNSMNTTDATRKQRLQTTLLAMVIIFAVSSLPLDLFNILQDMSLIMDTSLIPLNIVDFLYFTCHFIAMSGNLLNPLVYAWWNENFRRQIQAIISECKGEKVVRHHVSTHNQTITSTRGDSVKTTLISVRRELETMEDGDVTL